MSGLFGKGGASDHFAPNTEPMPLDFGGDKSEIHEKIQNPTPDRTVGPSTNYSDAGPSASLGGSFSSSDDAGTYQPGGGLQKPRVDSVKEFSDMGSIDGIKNEELRKLRLESYRLSNIDKEYEIVHKNDFNKIVKIMMISFAVLVLFGFIAILAVIGYTSVKAGAMTETGIINSILQFIADLMRIGLS